MSVITKEIAATENSLLNKNWLTFAFAVYAVFYAWVRWYEGVYGEMSAA